MREQLQRDEWTVWCWKSVNWSIWYMNCNKKNNSPPPNSYRNKSKGKEKSWRENETKNKIWSVWHIYKTDGLSARHWWIFSQDKNGIPVSKNNPLRCRPVWFSYTTGIQTLSLTSTFWLKVSKRRKNWTFCYQEDLFFVVFNQLCSL